MRNLILFLTRFRTFGLFLLMEGICAWLIIGYNQRQNASFLNSSNTLAASVSQLSNFTSEYLSLGTVNEQLLEENRKLREQVAYLANANRPINPIFDTLYDVVEANVVSSTYMRPTNYITLDAGKKAGIAPGMGVISKDGIVGQVKSVSNHYATVISILHQSMMISTSIKRTSTLCTTQWDGESPLFSTTKFVPRHIELQIGDSVVTSGYNSIFPPNILVGVISELSLQKEDAFYNIKIRLATDFTSLNYLYVLTSRRKSERDSLELDTQGL